MVLNHFKKEDNYNRCLSLKNDIENKHIKVKDVIICDCSNRDESQREILDRVLDYLTQRIDVLDNKYASACQQRLIDIQENIARQLATAKTIFGHAKNDDWNRKYVLLFSKLWQEINEDLEGLTRQMIFYRDTEDVSLKPAVEEAIKDCQNNPGIPSVKQILKKRDRHASFESAYAECQHEVRTSLSKRFLNLDEALEKSLEDAKSQVVDVLVDSGKLGNLAVGEGSKFLTNLGDKIPEYLHSLRLGFKTLASFNLEYRGLIQHRIRKHLDVLTPDRTKYKLNDLFSNLFSNNITNEQKAKRIHSNLLQAQKEAVDNCKKELNQILIEPNQAGFAIIEEFVDRVLRSEGVREEWEIFLQDYAPQVWHEEYESINANYQLKQEWISKIEAVESKSKLRDFKFAT